MRNFRKLCLRFFTLLCILYIQDNGFAQSLNPEIAFLQTDRTAYIAGESIFYKLYVLDGTTRKFSKISRVGYILIKSTNQNFLLKTIIKIDSGKTNGSIVLPDTLTSGVYEILAFTNLMKIYGDKAFYHKEIIVVNRFDKSLSFKIITPTLKKHDTIPTCDSIIQTDKTVYGFREKITVNLNKIKSNANISISVFENPPFTSNNKSIIETIDISKTLNTYMISDYLPENYGKTLTGSVVDMLNNQKIDKATILLSCPDSIPNLQYAFSDKNGKFHLILNDYYNGKDLFLSIKDVPVNQKWKIEVEDDFSLPVKWNPTLVILNPGYKDFFTKSQNIFHINKSYQTNNDSLVYQNSTLKSIRPQLYNCPAITIRPADYVSLNDFHEIVVELLPQLRISKHENKFKLQIPGLSTYITDIQDPVIFLDGVFVDDINKIIGLGSDKIKKIEIQNVERAFGDLVFQGIISITTKSNEITHTIPTTKSLRIKKFNYNTGESFIFINPNTLKDSRIPFVKQLLYWNPDLNINALHDHHFEFYSSDNEATFTINIEGISEDGTPISASSRIQVSNKQNSKAQ